MHDASELGEPDSPFHAGERAVQERLGVRERSERSGRRMIRDFMPEQHRDFFALLPFVLVGSLDVHGRPWASLLSGPPGFVTSPHPRSLIIGTSPLADDPLTDNLRVGAPLGLLGIELETRRRNRENGRVLWHSARGFELLVEQSFGNCKQYIQARTRLNVRPPGGAGGQAVPGGPRLDVRAAGLVRDCDTAFLATASAAATQGGAEGVDVSHRGGPPGFMRVDDHGACSRITLPDYTGNNMFNSLGNIEVRPRAGLLACDFESGDLLSLTGTARVLWDAPQLAQFPGALRLLQIDVERHVLLTGALLLPAILV